MNRKVLWAVLVIGAAMIVAPLAMALPSRSSSGQHMMKGFAPIMKADQVKTTAYYYDQVLSRLGPGGAGVDLLRPNRLHDPFATFFVSPRGPQLALGATLDRGLSAGLLFRPKQIAFGIIWSVVL